MTGDQGGLFSPLDLDLDDARPGFRLDRLEVFNWGTFDGRVFRLDLRGDTGLLTGDIGSGKSTLVDAMTTLLLPAQRINYNKAAGADTRERSLRSYVLGHYKAEQNETTGSRRSVGLRDHKHYSVLLAVFRNQGPGAAESVVTLAQVFSTRDNSTGQPQRFFVTSEREMSIEADFVDFGQDLGVLRRRLREAGAQISDAFPDYGARLRRLLGIHSDQALELLHQTISMKSVGNLTEFVRQHMLEGADARERIDTLLRHFDDLTQAHDAVREARDQLAALDPLVAHCDTHRQLGARIAADTVARAALPSWMAGHRVRLLDALTAQGVSAREAVRDEQARLHDRIAELAETRNRLERERDGVGGDRIAELERSIERKERERDERRQRARALAESVKIAGLPPVTDAASFARVRARAHELAGELDAEQSHLDNARTDLLVEQRTLRSEGEGIGREIRSLEHRESNIDVRSLRVREALAEGIGVPETELPFVGELVQVGAEHHDWRGAAERVLRGFALSVLVPAQHYEAAASWVNARHLGGRLVYYRVPARFVRDDAPLAGGRVLADLLEVRPGPHQSWLRSQLRHRRANHVCVDSIAELLQQRALAVTQDGQVRNGDRHEKDDRFAIGDRTRWVLGWSNADKIEALLARGAGCQKKQNDIDVRLREVERPLGELDKRRRALAQIEVYPSFTDVDWQACAADVSAMTAEKAEIEQGNEQLAQLTARLEGVGSELEQATNRQGELQQRIGELNSELTRLAERRSRAEAVRSAVGEVDAERYRAAYQALTTTLPEPSDEGACDEAEREHVDALTRRIDKAREAATTAANRAVASMAQVRQAWPALTSELDAAIEAADGFRALRDRVAGDDLPRFEAEFKEQLNTNAIRDIASFDSWLRRVRSRDPEPDRHHQRVTGGHRIQPRALDHVAAPAHPQPRGQGLPRRPARLHRRRPRRTDDQYSEERFLQVKASSSGSAAARARPSRTSAGPLWSPTCATGSSSRLPSGIGRHRREWEHYTDSDGKSGGQKEKLAYTILAASLAYQFRLQWGVRKSRTSGSPSSTRPSAVARTPRRATPSTCSPSSACSCSSSRRCRRCTSSSPTSAPSGSSRIAPDERSRLRTLTIEDYHAERWRLLGVQAEVAGFTRLLGQTRDEAPELAEWVVGHPMRALAADEVWSRALAAYRWLRSPRAAGAWLRQISAPGVDTKFVEQQHVLLAELLVAGGATPLPVEGSPGAVGAFAQRFGLRVPERLVQLRFDTEFAGMPRELSEGSFRLAELARIRVAVGTVVVVENLQTFQAWPIPFEGVVVWGAGYLAPRLSRLPWVREAPRVLYAGDLDTHGFAILSGLRAGVRQVESLAMDRETLLGHRDRWGTEPSPTAARLPQLTDAEADLYRDLVEHTYGPRVRLEQERLDWAHVRRLIEARGDG
jgi:uncharacterized protein YPO0396